MESEKQSDLSKDKLNLIEKESLLTATELLKTMKKANPNISWYTEDIIILKNLVKKVLLFDPSILTIAMQGINHNSGSSKVLSPILAHINTLIGYVQAFSIDLLDKEDITPNIKPSFYESDQQKVMLAQQAIVNLYRHTLEHPYRKNRKVLSLISLILEKLNCG